MVCCFKLVSGGVWQFVYDTNNPVFLESDLVGCGMNGNWQVWVRYCGSGAVSVHMVRKGTPALTSVTLLLPMLSASP